MDSSNTLWVASDPNVYSTSDLGQHWVLQSDTSQYFPAMASFGDTTFCLQSGNGLYYFATGSASVSEKPGAGVNVAIYPNPSRGEFVIAVPGARTMISEIYDLVGNQVAKITGISETSWKPAAGLSSGIYFVRISGIDANGNPFQTSSQISLE